MDGSQAMPDKPPAPMEILKAMATKITLEKLKALRNSVRLSGNPTPEQKAYAETVRKTLEDVALDFYFLGIRDLKIRQAEALRNQVINRAVMGAIRKGPNGEARPDA
jgi:hypothetical protein